MAEIRVARTRSDDEKIIRKFLRAVLGNHHPTIRINTLHLRHEHRGVRILAEQPTDGSGDVSGRKRRRRHLIQQRLKQVMVRAVEHEQLHVGSLERARGVQPTKPATDDDDARFATFLYPERKPGGHAEKSTSHIVSSAARAMIDDVIPVT
jgi:hypothetical protein